jgi:DNA-binding Lrp family transcriptional regulator
MFWKLEKGGIAMEQILEILERDNRITPEQIAVMLNQSVEEVKAAIKKLEDEQIILRYKTLINWEKTDREFVTALIEVKVTPQRGEGFDKVAERIYKYPQVKAVYLMSGGFDLTVIIEGRTMKEVALFVAEKLAPMESVLSTATHFVLKKYKDEGVIFEEKEKDDRQVITL